MPFQQYYPTGGGQLRNVFQYLMDYGFMDFLLPVLLLFTVMFALLQNIKLFKVVKRIPQRDAQGNVVRNEQGKIVYIDATENGQKVYTGDRKINSLISIVIAAMIVLPHSVGWYPPEMDPVIIINQFLPHSIVMLAALFVVILLFGLAGAHVPSGLQMLIAIISVGILALIFAAIIVPSWMPGLWWLHDPASQAIIIVLLVMGLVGYWVMKPTEPSAETTPQMLTRWMSRHPPWPTPPPRAGGRQ